MKALLKDQPLDDEGLLTLLCEVESIINGRLLTKVSDDPRDPEALTPNHLLLLRSGPTLPLGAFVKDDSFSGRRWRHVQYLADMSGVAGCANTCQPYKRDGSGTKQVETSLSTIWSWSLMNLSRVVRGHFVECSKFIRAEMMA